MVYLTHLGLGVDNDTVVAFQDHAEARIVRVPPVNHTMRARLASLDNVIAVSREELKALDGTSDAIACSKLAQQQRDSGKSMTPDNIILLASLDAQ